MRSAVIAFLTASAFAGSVRAAGLPDLSARSAEEVVREAVVQRLGDHVEIAITATGVTGDARVFREARLDPSAWLGKPVRFTLVTEDGGVLPVSVEMTVIGDRVVAGRAIERGAKVVDADVTTVRGEIVDVPLRRLPAVSDLVGGKALRSIAAGATVLSGFVTARRAVEPGDRVIATAAGGVVQVTAEFTAADGGAIGDVIRVVNPATKRYVRGRIVKEGFVEVLNGR